MTRAADRTHAVELRRAAGATAREIAKEFGITISRVRQILRQLKLRRVGEKRKAQPTSLEALEMAGKVRRQLRFALEAAGITDLTQLRGRRRFEVGLIRGISSKSVATIDAVMQEASLTPLE
jgi:transposase